MIGYIENTESSGLGSGIIAKEDFLGDFSVEFSLMEVPSIKLTLPIRYGKMMNGNTHIVIKTDDWVYRGYVGNKTNNFKDMTVSVDTSHVIGRLGKRTLPTNVTVKARSVDLLWNKLWAIGKVKSTKMIY